MKALHALIATAITLMATATFSTLFPVMNPSLTRFSAGICALTIVAIQVQQSIERVGQSMDWNLRHDLAEVRSPFVRAASADEHEVLRHGTRPELSHAALEPYRRDVMLAATVRASADLDVSRGHEIDELLDL